MTFAYLVGIESDVDSFKAVKIVAYEGPYSGGILISTCYRQCSARVEVYLRINDQNRRSRYHLWVCRCRCHGALCLTARWPRLLSVDSRIQAQ